jgi:hypothetical protein
MSKEQKKVLEMLVSNKINVHEACRLLFMVEPEVNIQSGTPQSRQTGITQSQYLRTCLMPSLNGFR